MLSKVHGLVDAQKLVDTSFTVVNHDYLDIRREISLYG